MRKLAIKFIIFYKKSISPLKRSKCRFVPTCSTYALECYQRFNFFKATYLTAKRILKCNPCFKMAYDPVPKKRTNYLEDDKLFDNIAKENNEMYLNL